MPLVTTSGTSIKGEQVLGGILVVPNTFVQILIDNVTTRTRPRHGFATLFIPSSVPGRSLGWQSRFIAGQGAAFLIPSVTPTNPVSIAVVVNWSFAGIAYRLSYESP